MARKKKVEEPPAGAPAWMMTFSDITTLLLTFFILIMTFSTIEKERFEKAKGAFRGALGVLSDEEERFLNLAWLSLARIYYSTKHFESAMEAWGKVPQSSEYYLDALFEESWAFFQVDELDRALGNIHTINSPYFSEAFYPESIVLKAVIYFGMCMFEDAQHTVDEFRKEYEPLQADLQKMLANFKDNRAFYDFLIKIREMDTGGRSAKSSGGAESGAVVVFDSRRCEALSTAFRNLSKVIGFKR